MAIKSGAVSSHYSIRQRCKDLRNRERQHNQRNNVPMITRDWRERHPNPFRDPPEFFH